MVKTWHGLQGVLEVVYVQVKRPLDWVILCQGPWCDEELTMAWEVYMQTEGLSQHVCCQHCNSAEKPITVVTLGKTEQRRQLVCFCTTCWSFTSRHHCKQIPMDVSFFKQYNPTTGRFHRALPYAEEEHPRRIRGPVTDHELDQFCKERLKLRKAGGPDKSTNELFRSLTSEELAVLFQSMAVSVFRFSAAQVRWSQAELDQLQSLWLQAYKRAESLINGTANDVFIFPKKWGGEELSTPVNIIAQELCNNITRCLVHDDVAKSITIQELQRAKDEWM